MRQAASPASLNRMNGCGWLWRKASQDGGRHLAEAGFTLLELLVVLGVIAIVVVAMRPSAGRTPAGLAPTASQVATNLRAAREAAIANDQPVALLIERQGTVYRFSGGRAGVQLPQGMRLSYEGTAGFQRAGLGDALEFFVDGTSTGGVVILRDGRGVVTMRVEALSGTVIVEPGP